MYPVWRGSGEAEDSSRQGLDRQGLDRQVRLGVDSQASAKIMRDEKTDETLTYALGARSRALLTGSNLVPA